MATADRVPTVAVRLIAHRPGADSVTVAPSDASSIAGVLEHGRPLDQLVLELAAANAHLERRYEQRLAIERQLRDVATGLHQVMDIDAVLSFGAAELASALGDRAVFFRLQEHGEVEVVAQWFDETVPPMREVDEISLPREFHELAWRLAASYETACIEDAPADPTLTPETREHLASLSVSAVITGAIQLVDHEVLLVAVHDLSGPRRWSDQDIVLFEGIIREIGTALRNAAAFEQQQLALRAQQQLDRDKDAFVSNVSHELRTPLTSILGYLELLRDDEAEGLTEGQTDLLDIVDRNAGRLLILIEDLLLLSRVQDEDRPSNREVVGVDDVIRQICATLLPTARERHLTLNSELPSHAVTVLGDPHELERALLNVVGNAVKFTPGGGRVQIVTSVQGDQVWIRISDDGIGIPAAEQDRLFERFFRGSAAQQAAVTGSGLGLAITRHIVQRHGGSIELCSEEGEGTTVTVQLPLLPAGHQLPSTCS